MNSLSFYVQAKAFAAEQQLKQALKDAEAARAIQSSANQANTEIQKAEQAAKLSFFKHSPPFVPSFQFQAGPWNFPHFAPKPIVHNLHSY